MLIVADAHIPFLTEAVQREWPDVDICPMKPDEINAETIRNAEVLIVRTRTHVNTALLTGSSVKMVCTATIGFDHIDTAYCDAHGIRWMSCPGCNAQAVCNYVEEALREIEKVKIKNSLTIGIVGVGHVGSRVAQMAERKGYKVLLNDPPKGIGVSFDEIAEKCDIITFHVPLTGAQNADRFADRIQIEFPTWHLCNEAFLSKCKPGAVIINAARGGVVDEKALLHSGHPYILDTWENEPDINNEVLQNALLASMHIAGYSVEGKRNASQMCLDAIAEQYGLPPIDLSAYSYKGVVSKHNGEPWLAAVTRQLKAHPERFETLRKHYPLRTEEPV